MVVDKGLVLSSHPALFDVGVGVVKMVVVAMGDMKKLR
jgi:hypothetical protein